MNLKDVVWGSAIFGGSILLQVLRQQKQDDRVEKSMDDASETNGLEKS